MKNIITDFIIALNNFNQSGISDALNFSQMNDALISYHSTAIEGSSLTEEETRLFLTEGLTAKGKPFEHHNMVKDHNNALLFVVEQANRKTDISSDLIRKINEKVMKTTGGIINTMAGSYDSSLGEFRKSMVHVGARYFSNYQKVPSEVNELANDINIKINDLKDSVSIHNLAFDAHYKLVSIHPFADGNGRTSRLLGNFILHYHKQPLVVVFKEDKIDYFNALEETRRHNDINIFRNFMFQQQTKYFEKELQKIDNNISGGILL